LGAAEKILTPDSAGSRYRVGIAALILLAFALRVTVCLARGETSFLDRNYHFYLTIAGTFLQGDGLCVAPGVKCALRMPVYPVFLSPFLATGWLYPGLVVVQSTVGAALTWLAWRLGRDLFDRATGLLAAFLTAINPYSVVHDTAVQETVVLNGLVALAVFWLLQSRRPRATAACLGAGVVLGLAVLTTARIAIFLPCAEAWALLAPGLSWRVRVRHAVLVLLPMVFLIGGWTVRNWRAVGAPVLTTEAGESLWVANNEWTFSHFPVQSIDLSAGEAYRRLGAWQQQELDKRQGSEVARDRLLAKWGLEYAAAHPWRTLGNGLRKIWMAASAELSPARAPALQFGYALLFTPVHLLAGIGLWRSRSAWDTHLIYLLFASFAITTATFWAHTSHKSYLDLFLFVYAASVISRSAFLWPQTKSGLYTRWSRR
jgi:4-amino-4-deoxy-L-arabinose transferase-like glycosyltransferase